MPRDGRSGPAPTGSLLYRSPTYSDSNGMLPDGTPGQLPDRQGIQVGGDPVEEARLRRQATMGGQDPYAADFSQSNQARDLSSAARDSQVDALGLQRSAALGNTPSRAELLGRQMGDDALHEQMAAAASARGGPMAVAAAQRAAAANTARAQQQTAASIQQTRAGEMAQARDAYQQGAGGIRSTDLGVRSGDLAATGLQSQNVNTQRGLNQTGSLGYQGLANDLAKTQAQVQLGQQQDDSANYRAYLEQQSQNKRHQTDTNQHSTDRSTGVIGSVIGAAGTVLGAISDPAAKTGVRSLDRPMGGEPSWMPGEEPLEHDEWKRYSPDAATPAAAPSGGGGRKFLSALGAGMSSFGRGRSVSDERSKRMLRPMDASVGGGVSFADAIAERQHEGRRDPTSFHRDDDADRKAVTKKYNDDLGRQADAAIAAYRRGTDEGPAVRRLAGGSKASGYETELTHGAEESFRRKYGDADTNDYDLRGAHAAGVTDHQPYVLDADSRGVAFPNHLPDTFKKPNHETFSGESQYAKDEPDRAGRWDGDRFVPPGHGEPPAWLTRAMEDYDRSPPHLAVSDIHAKREAYEMGRADQAAGTHGRTMKSFERGTPGANPNPLPPPPEPTPEEIARREHARARQIDLEASQERWRQDERDKGFAPNPSPLPPAPPPPERAIDVNGGGVMEAQEPRPADESNGQRSGSIRGYNRAIPRRQRAVSDERSKEGMRDLSAREAPPARMMDAIGGGKTFRYKPGVPGEDPNEQQYGTTTRDLKKTPMGATMVVPGSDETAGYEAIDVRKAAGPTMAALGNLNERLRAIESAGSGRKRKEGR